MTAPADIPALIAEGRRLIAQATADRVLPLKKTVREGYNTLIEADGAPLAMTDGDGSAYVEDCAVDVVAFAVAHLPTLLAVAEAADKREATLRAAAREALDVLTRLADSAHRWAGCDVPVGIVADVDAAKARLAGVLGE